jgi:intracellular septation protein A
VSAAVIISIIFALAILPVVGLVSRRLWLDHREERRRGLNRKAATGTGVAGTVSKACLSAIVFGLGPTLVFVLGFRFAPVASEDRIFHATGLFAIAVLAAMLWRLINPLPDRPRLPWRSLLIIAMAFLTIWQNEEIFIKVRPTIQNGIGAALALLVLVTKSPRLESFLGRSRIELDDAGWRKFAAGGAVFALLMALLNELVRRNRSTAFWVDFQLWGPPLFFTVFALLGFVLFKDHLPARQCKVQPANEQ